MVNLFRKYQQPLMIIFTVLLIIAFILLYNVNRTTGRSGGSVEFGKIYGHVIPQTQAESEARKFGIAQKLEINDLLGALVGRAQTQDQAINTYVWNMLVMRHEADQLQISPTDEDVMIALKGIPAFQTTDGAFDSGKYTTFVDSELAANGFTTEQLEDLMRDELRLKKIQELLNATFLVSPSAFRTVYALENQKMDVSVIRFNLSDFTAGVQITDVDIKKEYDRNKESYKSGEKRLIKYVTFALPEADKDLTGKERTEALQKLSNRAVDFTQAMLEKNAKFEEVAAKFNVPVASPPPFAEATPDPKLEELPELVDAAFRLTKDQPNSDAIQEENGFYVAQLEEIEPSKQLTFDEARSEITDQLKLSRGHELLNSKAADARNKIQADLAAGKSFADAVKDAGVKAEQFPPFSLSEPALDKPDVREITVRSIEMAEGQVSDFVPTPDGGIVIHLDKREPLDEAKFEKDSALLGPKFKEQKLNLVFAEWLRKQREAAGVMVPRAARTAAPAQQ